MNNLSSYYRNDLDQLYDRLVPSGVKKVRIGKKYLRPGSKYDYIILDDAIGDTEDIQLFLEYLKGFLNPDARLVISYYNHLWEPVLKLASLLGWRKKVGEQNWVSQDDIANFLDLTGFEIVNKGRRLLLPVQVPFFSDFINSWIAPLPFINSFCLVTWAVARVKQTKRNDYSVSIVIPARNEEGNIPKAVKLIPKFGKRQEIIFVEGHSKDNTWQTIQKEVSKPRRKGLKVSCYQQKGKGKADAVRLGFSKAQGELLMILDADLTVDPKELPKFYEALASGKGEYINGSRMVYPMEKEAMRTLNILGNKTFSWLFTWILGQRLRDTLCGTKVLLKSDYEKIVKGRKYFGDFDPFGDFDLIFGAVKQNLKVVEIPIRYKERTYGTTNISRFKHGWLLLKMTWFAFKKFKQ